MIFLNYFAAFQVITQEVKEENNTYLLKPSDSFEGEKMKSLKVGLALLK